MKQDLEYKKQQEDEILKYKFQAKDVPKHAKVELFKQIMESNEERRKMVKSNSVAITLQREKPFSFYKRDKENQKKPKKRNKYQREKFVFKANPIPAHVHMKIPI